MCIWLQIDEPNSWQNSYDEKNGWKGIKLLYMAGLYNVWQENDVIIYSYSIVTMESNSTLNWLHHRMPAILETELQIQVLFFNIHIFSFPFTSKF